MAVGTGVGNMGCCEARDKRGSYRDYKDEEAGKSVRLSVTSPSPQELFPFDSKFSELEAYSLYLSETTSDWIADCSDNTYVIKHLPVPPT